MAIQNNNSFPITQEIFKKFSKIIRNTITSQFMEMPWYGDGSEVSPFKLGPLSNAGLQGPHFPPLNIIMIP